MNEGRSQPLSGTFALVTGAGGGIGGAVCSALADAGAKVIATGRGEPRDVNAEVWLKHDVTSADDWSRVLDEIQSRFGRLDCLVNNAGIAMVESIASLSLEQWRRVSRVNVESVLLGLQACVPLLTESGRHRVGGSAIVNVSSIAALRGVAFNAAYCASKAAVTLLSKSAAKEFAALGYPIRVNSVHPGSVDTKMMDSILERHVTVGVAASESAVKASMLSRNLLGRMGHPDEIGGAVVFLCSQAASFMTGAELVIDGGSTA